MSPSAPASLGVVSRPPSEAVLEARLSFAEFLIGCEDIGQCAQHALDWLAEHARAREAFCAVVDVASRRLHGLAGHNVDGDDVTSFSLDVESRADPLVATLFEGKPIVFGGRGGEPRPEVAPLRAGSFLAFPLYGAYGRDFEPGGLLLVAPVSAELSTEALWLAPLLGHRIVRLQRTQWRADTDRRGRRDRVLLNAVPDPILLTDTEGRMLIANASARALLAAGEQDSEGRRRAVALNNMLFSSALAQSAIQGGAPTTRELLLVDPTEGSDLLFELLSTVVTDPREGTGIVSILRNVTDLRRAMQEIEENYRRLRGAEAEMRAERDRLDLIIDSVADPILVTDPSGRIVLMNSPAERLFTAPKGAPADVSMRVSANDAHFSSFMSNLFVASDLRRRGELGLVDPIAGEPLPVEAVGGKILSEHGEVTAVVTILHDRTEEIERARLYEQLKLASEQLEEKVREATGELVNQNELLRRQSIELEQASNLKSLFLANMSHEFRTPLNAIMGYTSMLLQGVSGALTAQQDKSLQRVDSNARHLLAIINDILDISRIEAGKMPLHVGRFSLQELIREVLGEVEPIIARTKLTVTTDVAADLPEVTTDRAKVKQIVINLLTNALKFTPQGWVKVSARVDREAKQLTVEVVDTGIGIAPEEQDNVFEDFRQVDSSPTRGYSGAGLGLSISRRLAHMLGGQLTLVSQPAKGSTFTLRLPMRPPRRK
jgi:signal transduction histidine kinase